MWFLFACADPAPVVSGVQPVPVEEVTRKREEAEARTKPEVVETLYKKADGVYVDVRFLSGRPYARVRDEVQAQLGGVRDTKDLGKFGEEKTFERGTLRVDVEGLIYLVAVDLPEPARRSEALAMVGMPTQIDRWITVPNEYRANNQFGIRRLRLIRVAPSSDEVRRVEAWWYSPTERH